MPRGASRQYLPGTGGTHPTSTIRPLVHGAHSLHAGSRILTRCRRYQRGELRCALETPAFKISLPWFGRLQDTRPSQLSSGRPALASFPRDRGAGFLLIFPAEGNYLEPLKPPGVYSSSFPICNPRRQPGPHYGLNREVLLAACRLPLFSATRRPELNRQTLALPGMHRVPAARPCWRTSLAAISNIAKNARHRRNRTGTYGVATP